MRKLILSAALLLSACAHAPKQEALQLERCIMTETEGGPSLLCFPVDVCSEEP